MVVSRNGLKIVEVHLVMLPIASNKCQSIQTFQTNFRRFMAYHKTKFYNNIITDVFAQRLQVQERLTHQILNCIQATLKALGVAVVIEAWHICMMMRGYKNKILLQRLRHLRVSPTKSKREINF